MNRGKSDQKKRLVLIDGHSVLYRAFHAYPPLTTSKGELVNAVYGFANILLSVIHELKPSHLVVCFDRAKPTFRHAEYVGYKAHRPEMPEDLASQQERVEEVVSVLNIPIFALEGYEADDVIATLARQASHGKGPRAKGRRKEKDIEVMIVTGDSDAFQLVRNPSTRSGQGRVVVYTPGRGKQEAALWDLDAVKERYGLKPEQLDDFKALAGDASDEIPGVRGIGPKTATLLLQTYGDLDGVYRHLCEVKDRFGAATSAKLAEGKDAAHLSKKLATLVSTVPITLDLKKCVVSDYNKDKAVKKFQELEFTSLIQRLPDDSFEQMVQDTLFTHDSNEDAN